MLLRDFAGIASPKIYLDSWTSVNLPGKQRIVPQSKQHHHSEYQNRIIHVLQRDGQLRRKEREHSRDDQIDHRKAIDEYTNSSQALKPILHGLALDASHEQKYFGDDIASRQSGDCERYDCVESCPRSDDNEGEEILMMPVVAIAWKGSFKRGFT